ncbi:hypothetical protein AJ79_10183 [Helicocarpus griseus UAMH5409]|uniref:Endonuclease/exonuclease/phosphatase domain-containing protein n=1 Tax=Helicocarpus griseus UAMH5409 TaxID=1447875 RepID=A0A2B7WF80_9EURO|nr:hypothetical protein AJ79_10183 [Helicocarpus griseus UAMH5409]
MGKFSLFTAFCATLLLWPAIVCAHTVVPLTPRQAQPLSLRLLSFNIRYAASPSGNEKAWSDRRDNLITQVAFETGVVENAFVGMQEVLHSQLENIVDGLNSHPSSGANDWTHIGVGRDDGKEKGEYSPLLYRESIWELLESTTKWLSETPDVPSYGWGANHRRIVTIGVFKNKKTEVLVLAMNTHFDHEVSEARLRSAELILKLIEEYKAKEEYKCKIVGVTLTGDFNSDEDQEAYKAISESGVLVDPTKSFEDKHLYGNRKTFTGFDSEVGQSRLDYAFVGQGNLCDANNQANWTVNRYGVLANKFDDGIIFSDHRAVIADAHI